MFKSKKEFDERAEILAYLEVLLDYVQSLHNNLGAVIGDVAAIRSTMSEDAEEIALIKSKLRLAMRKAQPMVDERSTGEDGLVEELWGSKEYSN